MYVLHMFLDKMFHISDIWSLNRIISQTEH